jgi:hypothetical protein
MIPRRVVRNVTSLLPPLLLLGVLAVEPAAARGVDRARQSLFLAPSARYQTRTFTVPAPAGTCAAFASGGPCRLIVSAELRGRGVDPMRTGSRFLTGPHVQTGYASISVCLSGETRRGTGNCNTSIPYCSSRSVSACAPAWNARVATEYQYNGTVVRRIWLDPSGMGGLGFIVRSVRSFSLSKVSRHGPLAIGEDITVTGSIPSTRRTRVTLSLRMIVSPTGGVRYTAQGR